MPAKSHFKPSLFRFLRELKANNDRDWFKANKERYEREVKGPLLAFIDDFAPELAKISSHYVSDSRPVGGSMFRIYRDTRFSKDKSPYKTAASARFHHIRRPEVHAPGFYLHLEPGSIFSGSGIWHPDGKTLAKIRSAIDEDQARWKRIHRAKRFKDKCTVTGDSLKRVPRGFDADHPLAEDLKRKDFITVTSFSEREACSAGFLRQYADACKAAGPYVRFIADALELDW